jgi:hypothetical protein
MGRTVRPFTTAKPQKTAKLCSLAAVAQLDRVLGYEQNGRNLKAAPAGPLQGGPVRLKAIGTIEVVKI